MPSAPPPPPPHRTRPAQPTDPSSPEVVPPASQPVGHAGARVDVAEHRASSVNGFAVLAVAVALVAVAAWRFALIRSEADVVPNVPIGVALVVIAGIICTPLVVIAPGQARVVQFFGRYIGTVREQGLRCVLPLATHRGVSVRVNNFETHTLKVNDADGNPVEIAAIVVWQVADTARATFAVEDYHDFVQTQAEAALRHVATSHPYDDPGGDGTSLRGSTDQVSAELAHEVAARVAVAGVEIVEVRISHLAYAPEIAHAMLQRQQAAAVIAARERIVDGAVGMVEMALGRLEAEGVVQLDDERRAAMVSNLLVVLCGSSQATPVVNTGSLYT